MHNKCSQADVAHNSVNQSCMVIFYNMVIFYKRWKKYNEIQLTKSKMDLNI